MRARFTSQGFAVTLLTVINDRSGTPEGALIREARLTQVPKRSVRMLATEIGLSEGRWRQLESGWQSVGGERIPIPPGPADTVARMALVAGVDVDRLREVRPDAADYLARMQESRESTRTVNSADALGTPALSDRDAALSRLKQGAATMGELDALDVRDLIGVIALAAQALVIRMDRSQDPLDLGDSP